MKTILALTLALLGTAAMADNKIVLGCEVVDMGGYSNKVDPTCVFSVDDNGSGATGAPGTTIDDIREIIENL